MLQHIVIDCGFVFNGCRGALLLGNEGHLREEAPCGVSELVETQASVSKNQLKKGIKGMEGRNTPSNMVCHECAT